ncbi:MAG: ABC transporter permease [Lachnospiraceae bacterium]|nr:ABC transporter permease [Lachnospiraceae bacterium]
MKKISNNRFVKAVGFNRILLCFVLILLYFLFTILVHVIQGQNFISLNRIFSALNYAYFMGLLSLGVTFVIATGGIDFSIGPVMYCAALISGYLLTANGWPLLLCLLVSILVGSLFGMLNGYLVAYWNLPSFITSMASMMLARGVGSVFTRTQSVSWPQAAAENGQYRMLVRIVTESGTTIPTGLFVLILISIICAIILNKTKAGRYILCIGSNKEAVRLSGVNVKRWEMLAYIICGTLAGMAAILFVGAYTTVQPGLGDTFNNEAIAGSVMGGTAMSGGVASIGGTFLGVMIIALLQEGILAMGFQRDYQFVITGIIVLVAVYVNVRSQKRKN